MKHDTAAAALADELRGIAEALVTREVSGEALEEARTLAGAVRRQLEGPARERWYESGGGDGSLPSSRRAYLLQSPLRGRANPIAPPLELETRKRADGSPRVIGRVRLGRQYEGPPHGVHGGIVAALFDEVLGQAHGASGKAGVTALLRVRFRHVTPIEEELRFEGWVSDDRGRRVHTRATCHAGETLTADAEAVFIIVDFDAVGRRMQQRRGRSDGPGPA